MNLSGSSRIQDAKEGLKLTCSCVAVFYTEVMNQLSGQRRSTVSASWRSIESEKERGIESFGNWPGQRSYVDCRRIQSLTKSANPGQGVLGFYLRSVHDPCKNCKWLLPRIEIQNPKSKPPTDPPQKELLLAELQGRMNESADIWSSRSLCELPNPSGVYLSEACMGSSMLGK